LIPIKGRARLAEVVGIAAAADVESKAPEGRDGVGPGQAHIAEEDAAAADGAVAAQAVGEWWVMLGHGRNEGGSGLAKELIPAIAPGRARGELNVQAEQGLGILAVGALEDHVP